jgi:hypothetical protein
MNKKLALIILILFNALCLFALFYFSNEIRQVFRNINNQTDMVIFNSKEGFFVFASGLPIISFFIILEHIWFEFIKRHTRSISFGCLAMLILLFISAITISVLIKAKVENAGYVNCKALEWSGTYSVSYTYTRNQAICEQLVAEKAREK